MFVDVEGGVDRTGPVCKSLGNGHQYSQAAERGCCAGQLRAGAKRRENRRRQDKGQCYKHVAARQASEFARQQPSSNSVEEGPEAIFVGCVGFLIHKQHMLSAAFCLLP